MMASGGQSRLPLMFLFVMLAEGGVGVARTSVRKVECLEFCVGPLEAELEIGWQWEVFERHALPTEA